MTAKTDFTQEEWQLVLEGPPSFASGTSSASRQIRFAHSRLDPTASNSLPSVQTVPREVTAYQHQMWIGEQLVVGAGG
jgi:hypothetical protein